MLKRQLQLCPRILGRIALLLGMCWVGVSAHAVIETYEFEDDALRERYHYFTGMLRCPKCQNQNLSGSNSPIAADLRREVHRLLHEGYSDAEIRDYMVSRYGEFILYQPPVNQHTVVLWLFPVVLLGVGALVLTLVLRRRARPSPSADTDEAQLQRADELRRQFGEEKP